MKFLVLALDFDGTIAQNDVLDPDVRRAITEARARGITVLLVTGRILSDLRRVCGDLHFVDAVVAENGACLEFPTTGYTASLAPEPPQSLLDELRRRGIPHMAGRTVVEVAASDGCRIVSILQKLELPLTIQFNRGRAMILPQAVSKAAGLLRALIILRLSPHNALGIGDAENDHELLRVCEVGAAVAWGSETLKAAADYVIAGDGPAAVAAWVRELAANGYLPVPPHARRRLMLGYCDDGTPLALAVRGRNVLVAGDSKSGKSWVTGLLCEQLILFGYSLCILDPEGDYASLEALPGVVVFGGGDPLPRPREVVRTLRHSDASIVIDMSHTSHQERLEYMRTILPALAVLRRRTGLPHRIVLDEAHYFLQDSESRQLLDFDLNGYTLVTWRASLVPKDVLKACQAILVTRESDPEEIQSLRNLCTTCSPARTDRQWADLFQELVIGEAVALPVTEEAHGDAQRIHLAPRLSPHVRHLSKYVDIPVSPSRAFVFRKNSGITGETARTLREFVGLLETHPLDDLDNHLRCGDSSRWIGDVFGDHGLSRAIRKIEGHYQQGHRTGLASDLAREIRERYDLDPDGVPAAGTPKPATRRTRSNQDADARSV